MLQRLKQWLEGDPETLTVFPSYARIDDEGRVKIPVRAWIFEEERESRARAWLVRQLRKGMDFEDGSPEGELFRRRVWPFLADNERWEKVTVEIGGHEFDLGRSSANGHVRGTVEISVDDLGDAVEEHAGGRFIEMKARSDSDQEEILVPIVDSDGRSVISDIDDTIKVTSVLERTEMLLNTFARPFRPVEGMSELYREWAGPDTHFHYLSASPWQLLPFLQNFAEEFEFPPGSFHLRTLRVKSISSPYRFVSGSQPYKIATISRILKDFPKRDFFLVGDSGEHDPEVYGEVAREFPGQVEKVIIRAVEGAENEDARFEKAFEGADVSYEVR